MINFMINLVRIIIVCFIALLFDSCKYDYNLGQTITGSGKVIEQQRTVGNFDKIAVSRGLDCEVIQSDKINVTVIADDNLQEAITTNVNDGTLEITSKYNHYEGVSSKKIIVQLPTITSLKTSSGSYLYTKNTIKSNNISLISSSGSKLNAQVASEKISLEASSGSNQEIEGKAVTVESTSSSGSNIDAGQLFANDIKVSSSSGSNTTVNPALSLQAKASSGSEIKYIRVPKVINQEQSSGGNIHN